MRTRNSPEFFLEQESFKNWVFGLEESDCQYWDTWVKENPEQMPAAMLAARILTGLQLETNTISDAEIESEWQKLKVRRLDETGVKPMYKKSTRIWWKSIAAVFVLVLSAWIAYFISLPKEEQYITGFSGKKNIKLSDGTEIILNSNSSLTAKSSWRFAPAREIWLEGEAYFNVVSHPEEPSLKQFVVHTKDLDVKVLGTQFNVNTRKKTTRVFLNEGKVQLALKETIDKNTILMAPGEYVDYSSQIKKKTDIKSTVSSEVVTSWKSGYFTFNNTPLSEVIEMVENSHGMKINLADDRLLNETLTGKVPSDNINELLNSMSTLFKLKYSIKGKEILLEEKK